MWLWIVFILLLVLMVGGLPSWPHMSPYGWGYFPSGLAAIFLVLLILLLVTGRV